MDFDEVLETDLAILKCVLCGSWLSYFPIYITDQKDNICGRCVIPTERKVVMNEAFQAVAKHIFFPCRYTLQGCDQKLRPKEVISHENRCLFRIVKCPVKGFSQCSWEDAKPNLLEHCHESHSDLFLTGGKLNLLLSSTEFIVQHNLFEHNSVLFVIVQKFNPLDQFLDFSIFHIESDEDLDQLSCKVELRTDNRHLVAACCTTSYLNQHPTEIYLSSLKDSKNATTTISVTGEIRLQNLTDNTSQRKTNTTVDLLAQLKCSICATYVLPPILQYMDASNQQKLVCSNCPAPKTSSSRNFNLDNLANLIDYPCENTNRGCNFIAKPSGMLKHKKLCLYQNLPCPVNGFGHSCNWSGLYGNLKIHLQANHSGLFIGRSTVIPVKVANCLGIQFGTKNNATDSSIKAEPSTASKSNFNFGNVDSTGLKLNLNYVTTASHSNFTDSSLKEPQSKSSTSFGVSGFGTAQNSSHSNVNIRQRQPLTAARLCTPSATSAAKSNATAGFSPFGTPAATCKESSPFGISAATSNIPPDYPLFGSTTAATSKATTVSSLFGTSAVTSKELTVNSSIFTSAAINKPNQVPNSFDFGLSTAGSLNSEDKHLFSPLVSVPVDPFLKKQCHLAKCSNKLFRVIYGETADKFIWCVYIIGPFTEEFMFCLDIVDKQHPKKIFKMQLPSMEFTKEDDIINSSCYVWKKDIAAYLRDNEINFKICVSK